MKKIVTINLFVMAVVFAACQREFGGSGEQEGGQAGFEIAEAKQFFEQKYTELSSEIVTLQGFVKSMFDPGEFTPLWDKAREWGDGHTGYMAIPFIADYTYEGSFTVDPSAEKPERYMTTVSQRLLIGNGSGQMEGHIVSIVPSRDYYQRYGLASGDRFAPVGSDFDGIVFYTSLNCVDIVRLEKYSRGMLVETAEVDLSANDPKDRYGKLYSLAGQFGVNRRARMQSRSSENGNTSYTIYHGTNLSGIQSYRGSCIAQGMASVGAALGGSGLWDERFFINQYYEYSRQENGFPIDLTGYYINANNEHCYGMINSNVSGFMDLFFTTVPYTGLYNAVSAGNYVFTNISTPGGGGHDIIICGYSTSNDIIYYDTADGTYKTMSAFGIKGDYYVEVTGVETY